MKVVRNYLYNVGYQVLAIIVPLITSAYVSRVLRPEGVGANAFTNSIIQYFILFASMGIGYYGNRQIAYVREDSHKMAQTFWEIQIVKTMMTLLSIIAFEIFMMFYTRQPEYMIAQSINLVAVAFDISWFYEGIEDFKVTVLKNSFVKLISMAAIFLLIKGPYDVTLYIVVLAVSTLLGNLTLWPNIKKDLPKININILNPWRHFLPMAELFIPQIATQVYVQLNKTMLGGMVSETSAGYYQYSDNLVKLILALVTATGTVMLPHVANAVSKGNMREVNQMLYKSFDFVSAVSYPMMFGLAAISLTLAPKYYDNTVVGYSYSKSLSLPGERIGYLVIPDEMKDSEEVLAAANVATRILGFVNAPTLQQKVVEKCLNEKTDLSFYDRNREDLYNGLKECGFDCIKPQGAFYLFVKSPVSDEKQFCEAAKKYNILIVPGSSFACPGYVRLAYCVSHETIIRSLPKFKELAKEYF